MQKCLLTFALLFYSINLVADSTFVSGPIVDQTWTADNSPYCVEGDIFVAGLVIEPNVKIVFLGNYVFRVSGILTAVGLKNAPIIFTKTDEISGWQGIYFQNTQPGSKLAYCHILHSINSGIRIINSVPIIENCQISNNYAQSGGGIKITLDGTEFLSLKLRGCIVTNNSSTFGGNNCQGGGNGNGGGGGIYASLPNGELILEDCQISNNVSGQGGRGYRFGSGIYVGGKAKIKRCLISNNSCYSYCCPCVPSACTIGSRGGGIYGSGDLTVENSIIRNNLVYARACFTGSGVPSGGGLYFSSGIVTLKNSVFSNNQASGNGPGNTVSSRSAVFINSGLADIVNCTIAYNAYPGLSQQGGTVDIMNSIIYFNGSPQISGDTSAISINYSIVEDGYPGVGNINFDPVFATPDSLVIVPGSPAIDAGNPMVDFNDICFPPSLGAERNDIGAHGGPGACGWFPNEAPRVITPIPDQNFAEDSGPYVAVSDLNTVFADPNPGDVLIFNTATDKPNIQANIQGNSLLIDSSPDHFGNGNIIVTAKDQGLLTVSDTFLVTITAVNDPPTVDSLPDIYFPEDSSYTLDLNNFATDVDNVVSELRWVATVLQAQSIPTESKQAIKNINAKPFPLAIDTTDLHITIDSTTHIATFTSTPDSTSIFTVVFSAMDPGGLGDTDTMLVTVGQVNDPPHIVQPLPTFTFNEDDSLLYPRRDLYDYVHDVEDPDTSLIFSIFSGSNVVVVLADSIYKFNAPLNWFGSDTLQLSVIDGGLLADTADLFINVNSVNDFPTIQLPDSLQFYNDTSAVLDVWTHVKDVETPDSLLNYDFSANNDSLAWDYNSVNGEITLTAPNFTGLSWFYVTISDDSSATAQDSILIRVNQVTGIENFNNQVPHKYFLFQNYPNPFNPVTYIRFGLPKLTNVKIEVYNIVGERMAILLDARKPAGYHVVAFNGRDISSGLYFYRIYTAEFQQVEKMLLIK